MKPLLLLLLLAIPTVTQAQSTPVTVNIQNASFEDVSFSPPGGMEECGLANRYVIPGWTFHHDELGSGGGVLRPASPPLPGCWPLTAQDGQNVAFAGGGESFSQDTGVKPSELQVHKDGFYKMKFWVANYFGAYPGYFEGKILLVGSTGTQELCSTDGWAMLHWAEVTLTCPSPYYLIYDQLLIPGSPPADPNAHLAIVFSATGWTVLFDNVSLTFTPET